jgi:hypothetical protein
MYLLLVAKNYFYEGKTETRFLDLTIVCNVMYSSGPPDLAGVFRRLSGESDDIEKAEEVHDASNLNRAAVSGASGARSKKKGDKPQVKHSTMLARLLRISSSDGEIPTSGLRPEKVGSAALLCPLDCWFVGGHDQQVWVLEDGDNARV